MCIVQNMADADGDACPAKDKHEKKNNIFWVKTVALLGVEGE